MWYVYPNYSKNKSFVFNISFTTSNTLCFLLIDNMMFQLMDQAMYPVKAQAMDMEKDLGQVIDIDIKVLRNNNLHHKMFNYCFQ